MGGLFDWLLGPSESERKALIRGVPAMVITHNRRVEKLAATRKALENEGIELPPVYHTVRMLLASNEARLIKVIAYLREAVAKARRDGRLPPDQPPPEAGLGVLPLIAALGAALVDIIYATIIVGAYWVIKEALRVDARVAAEQARLDRLQVELIEAAKQGQVLNVPAVPGVTSSGSGAGWSQAIVWLGIAGLIVTGVAGKLGASRRSE